MWDMDKKYHIISSAIAEVMNTHDAPQSLDRLAQKFSYDPVHFQKIFKQNVGLSPKDLYQFLNYKTARDFLFEGHSTLESAYRAGLSGNGRLHDLFLKIESVTPGDVRNRGEGLNIIYGIADTIFGAMMIAQTSRGICWIGFQIDGHFDRCIERMRGYFPRAHFVRDDQKIEENANKINQILHGDIGEKPITLDIYGSNFQIQVWRALLQIPLGHVVSYQAVADAVGNAKASRAVGTAVGSNPISFLIPCHRVIQSSGIVENYGWGTPCKKMLLGIESQFQKDKKSSIV